jgi:hypothetical protein
MIYDGSFDSENNGGYLFLQLRHIWKQEQCDSRYMHQICMKIMLLMKPTNFVKQTIFENLADF